jgi:CHRD domain
MKHLSKMIILAFSIAILFTACSKDDDDNNPGFVQEYRAELRGVHAIPTNSSSATAIFNGSYNSETQILSYSLTYAGMTPTSWAIHVGAAGTAGPVVFPLGAITASPKTGSVTLSAAQFTNLSTGLLYVNITSLGFPDGEVRGQIIKI